MTPRVKALKVQVKQGCVVYHEGVGHQPGQTIELPPEQAQALLDQDVVEKA